MSKLLVLGNTNQGTFANSIVAANGKSLEIFSKPLETVFVLHSRESEEELGRAREWRQHLNFSNVNPTIISYGASGERNASIVAFVEQVELVLRSIGDLSSLLVDLSNGTTVQRTMLSTASYVLDLKHQFMIDVAALKAAGYELSGFLSPEALSPRYVPAPSCRELDALSYLSLTEILRYRELIKEITEKYELAGNELADTRFFRDNLAQSIKLRFDGKREHDNSLFRIAAATMSSSIEDLIRVFLERFEERGKTPADKRTLGPRLEKLERLLRSKAPDSFDFQFITELNKFMLYLRNSAVHKGSSSSSLDRFRADLSLKVAVTFIEFYLDVVWPALDCTANATAPRLTRLREPELCSDDPLYFGLDGDNTGAALEYLLISSGGETEFIALNTRVDDAIKRIRRMIEMIDNNNLIFFAAGDDLLFRGRCKLSDLESMQQTYTHVTSGLTCSIAYGVTLKDVYWAMKLAKAQPGKSSIVGVSLS